MELAQLLSALSTNGGGWVSSIVIGIVGVLCAYNIIQQTFDNKKQANALNEIIEIEREARKRVTEELNQTTEDLRQVREAMRKLQKELERCYGSKASE